MKRLVIPAIIAKNQHELDTSLGLVKDHVEVIQLDFMDGNFVPNSSLDFDMILPDLKYEAHLMVKEPKKYIDKYLSKIDVFLLHFESLENPVEMIDYVRSKGKKVGLVINPSTSAEKIKPYLGNIDEVLIMTVEPGFYGSTFVPSALDKVRYIRHIKPDMDIEVDGSINDKTIIQAWEAGANLFVSGSYVLKSDNPKKALEKLKTSVQVD